MKIVLLIFCFFMSCAYKNLDIEYYPNGLKKYENEINNEMLHGVSKYWDNEGNLINMVNYVNNLAHGEWTNYYLSGKIRSISNYQFGIKEGLETTFYENGNKKTEIMYKNGSKISEPILLNESGSLIE